MIFRFPNKLHPAAPSCLRHRWPVGVMLIDCDSWAPTLDDEPCERAVYIRTSASMALRCPGASRLNVRAGLEVTDTSLLKDDLCAVARDLGLDDGGRKSEVRQRILDHLGGA